MKLDLECTGMDDHDPAPCPKCKRITDQVKTLLAAERERCAKIAEEWGRRHYEGTGGPSPATEVVCKKIGEEILKS